MGMCIQGVFSIGEEDFAVDDTPGDFVGEDWHQTVTSTSTGIS